MAAALGGLYTMWLGWCRFRCLHLGARMPFAWKLHVRLGSLVLLLWAVGPLLGLLMAHILWGGLFISGTHAWAGVVMAPLAVFGYATGYMLDKVKKRRVLLPLVHGTNNLLLVLLALWQCWTGWQLLSLL